MAETRWTPGPWAINEDDRPGMSWNREIVWGDGENRICFMAHSGAQAPKQDKANAYLIAAAPKMAQYIQKRGDLGDAEAAALWEFINARS